MKAHRSSTSQTGIIAIFATAAITTSIAQADIITYDIVWEPVHSGAAFGSLTIDTVLVAGASSTSPFGGAFTDFSITISGTSAGDGTYTSDAGDVTQLLWVTLGPLDFNSELISQGALHEFGLIGDGFIPAGTNAFRVLNGGEEFVVVSMTPIPAPNALALLGLGTLVAARRRR